MNDLKQDDLAREIIDRVDLGPYVSSPFPPLMINQPAACCIQGPAGRRSQPPGATKEDFFASILRSNNSNGRDTSRSRRQSRVSREIVSSTQGRSCPFVVNPMIIKTSTFQIMASLSFRPRNGKTISLDALQDCPVAHFPRVPLMVASGPQARRTHLQHSDGV